MWARIFVPSYDLTKILNPYNGLDGSAMESLITNKEWGMGANPNHSDPLDYGTTRTKSQIKSSLEKLAGQTYLVPYDGQTTVWKDANGDHWKISDPSTCISNTEFASWVSKIPSKNTLVIFDACFSGALVTTTLKEGNKYAVLTSSEGDEDSRSEPTQAGYFTSKFADTFEDPIGSADTDGDHVISAEEAFDVAAPQVTKIAEIRGKSAQHPEKYGRGLGSDIFNLKHVHCDQPSYSQLTLVSASAATSNKSSTDHMKVDIKETAVITYQLTGRSTSDPRQCGNLANQPVTLYYGGYTEPPKCSCDPNEGSWPTEPYGKCIYPEPKAEWKEVETKSTDGNGCVEWRYPRDGTGLAAGTYYFKVTNGEGACGSLRYLQVDVSKLRTVAWGKYSHPVAKIKHPCWTGGDEGFNNTYCVLSGEKFSVEGHLVALIPDPQGEYGYRDLPLGNKEVTLWRVDEGSGFCGNYCKWTYVKSATTDGVGYFKFKEISEEESHFKCPFITPEARPSGYIGTMLYFVHYKPVGDDEKYFECTESAPCVYFPDMNTCLFGGLIDGEVYVYTDMGCYDPNGDPPCIRGLLGYCRCGDVGPVVG